MSNDRLINVFEDFINKELSTKSSFHPYFQKAYSKMFKAGGKRFRPLLLLLVVDAYQKELVSNALPVAMALEMFHTYSLIHDDLPTFDDANLRRGEETLHVSYDEVTATLVGDALNSDAFFVIADSPLADDVKIELIKILSKNGGGEGMVLGQAIDCYFENRRLDIDKLKFLHIHKTAKLIAASLKMGAVIANLSTEKKDLLYDLGLKIGLLFQIEDDIIDATQSKQEAGKPTNSDKDKNSFVNLLTLDGAKDQKIKLLNEIKDDLSSIGKPLSKRLDSILNKYFE